MLMPEGILHANNRLHFHRNELVELALLATENLEGSALLEKAGKILAGSFASLSGVFIIAPSAGRRSPKLIPFGAAPPRLRKGQIRSLDRDSGSELDFGDHVVLPINIGQRRLGFAVFVGEVRNTEQMPFLKDAIRILGSALVNAERTEYNRRTQEGLFHLAMVGGDTGWNPFVQWLRKTLSSRWLAIFKIEDVSDESRWSLVAASGSTSGTKEIPDNPYLHSRKDNLLTLQTNERIIGMLRWRGGDSLPPWLLNLSQPISIVMEHYLRNQALQEAAYRDRLTGLFNRAYLEEIVANGGFSVPSAYVMLDLDRFKELNDAKGHEAGDNALRILSERIKRALREADKAIRFGGDEFVLILSSCPPSRCTLVVKRILEQLRAGDFGLGVSAGIALAPENGTTYAELYHAADTALYRVKRMGRNGIALAGKDSIHFLS